MTQSVQYRTLGVAALVLVLGVLGVTGVAAAYQGTGTGSHSACTAEQQEGIHQAIADRDYEAWQELMAGKGRVTELVTADTFAAFAHAHDRRAAGDEEGANEIKRSLGLGLGQGQALGQKGRAHGAGDGTQTVRQYQYQHEYRMDNR